ncbi:MAG: hypothetical protein ACREKE_00995, partial [bacterium]
ASASTITTLTAGTIVNKVCAIEGCHFDFASQSSDRGCGGCATSNADFRGPRVTTAWAVKTFGTGCSQEADLCGGSVYVYPKASGTLAEAEADQPERDLVAGNVLMTLSGGLPISAVAAYQEALHQVTGLAVQVVWVSGVGGTSVVHGTPSQPSVIYTIRLDQTWIRLGWTDGDTATVPVQVELTITNTGHVPVRYETPAADLTLVVPRASHNPAQSWSGKVDYGVRIYKCPRALTAVLSVLNPGRSVTGCLTFAVPTARWHGAAEIGRAVFLWWIPQGTVNQDQKSYEWAFNSSL